jgi:penicillin-binding protein-related factor A (putative recombinase)
MNEKIFSKQLRDDIAQVYPQAHQYLIQDSYRSGKKPYDFYVLNMGNFYAVECKYIKGKSIGADCVSPHQLNYLSSVKHNRGRARIVMGLHSWNGGNHALVLTIPVWKHILVTLGGSSSIKIDEILIYLDKFESESDSKNGLMDRTRVNKKLQWDVTKVIS